MAGNLRFNMERSRNMERISRPSGSNLRQGKLNLSPDMPPGYERNHHLKTQLKPELPHFIKWECPPSFALKHEWKIVAGEKSKEKDVQKHRETKVKEVIYPRISTIPPGPVTSPTIEKEYYNDSFTPLVPLIDVEEEEYSRGLKRKRSDDIIEPREEVRFRTNKLCKFFNTWRGCRNGSSCPYEHDISVRREYRNVYRNDRIIGYKMKGRIYLK